MKEIKDILRCHTRAICKIDTTKSVSQTVKRIDKIVQSTYKKLYDYRVVLNSK